MTWRTALVAELRKPDGQIFAVVDGALEPDLPSRLRRVGFSPRALYKGHASIAGPQLVNVGEAFESLLDGFGPFPPAVFWCGETTEDSLYSHLRRLGRIEVPVAGSRPVDQLYEPVTFRYADPNSLEKVVPVLKPMQRIEFCGEATKVLWAWRNRLDEKGISVLRKDGTFRSKQLADVV